MPTRENNTMAEGLSKILKDISGMKIEPDADMGFLVNLETTILQYLKPPVPGQGGGGQGGAPQGPPGMGQMAPAMGAVMGGGGGAPMGPPPGGMGMPGMQMSAAPGPGLPNPDEFRRGLGQAAERGSARQLIHKLVRLNPVTPGF